MCVITLALSVSAALAQTGQKWGYKKQGDVKWTYVESMQYVPSQDIYKMRSSVTYPVDRKVVTALNIPKPTNFDQYRMRLKPTSAQPSSVVGMEAIRKKYTMLQWDVEALKILIPIYDHKQQYSKVIDECNYLKKWYKTVPEELVGYQWKALAKDRTKVPQLKKVLREAIESGTRKTAAMAHILRGDILKDEGKLKEALVDGYFRVILLFKDVPKDVQAEAHFKAWEVLKQVRDNRAEKIKRKLLDEFPRSEYAKRLGAAGGGR